MVYAQGTEPTIDICHPFGRKMVDHNPEIRNTQYVLNPTPATNGHSSLYNLLSYLKRIGRFWHRPADVPRHCIFDDRYGCVIPQPIPTQSLGTSFDLQAMANNCGYGGGKDNWWHIHHSAPAFYGGMAQSCPHSYKPGHLDKASPCKCEKMEFWQEKITHANG